MHRLLIPFLLLPLNGVDVDPRHRIQGSPQDHLPPNIELLTTFGERQDISPDNRPVAFITKTFGDAMVIDLATRRIDCLTCGVPHARIRFIGFFGGYVLRFPVSPNMRQGGTLHHRPRGPDAPDAHRPAYEKRLRSGIVTADHQSATLAGKVGDTKLFPAVFGGSNVVRELPCHRSRT